MRKNFQSTSLPPVEFAAAQHFEFYGSTLTTNAALKVTVLILAAVIALLTFCVLRTAKTAANVKPLIVRINDVGRAEALAYSSFTYKPQAPEIRYFLSQFVVGYYSRNHKTVAQQYGNSLYFLDRSLFNIVDAQDRKSNWIAKFAIGTDDDVQINVDNVVIENLETEPYRARVEYTKVFINQAGGESKRESWAAEFFFRINHEVPNDLILHNPLGLSLTYFTADQAFK